MGADVAWAASSTLPFPGRLIIRLSPGSVCLMERDGTLSAVDVLDVAYLLSDQTHCLHLFAHIPLSRIIIVK